MIRGFRVWDDDAHEFTGEVDFGGEEAEHSPFTGELDLYGQLLSKSVADFDTEEHGWGQWRATFSRGRLLTVFMTAPSTWIVPEGFPPPNRGGIMERALKLISWGTAGHLHYDEIRAVADEVLQGGSIKALELYEKERAERGLDRVRALGKGTKHGTI